MSTKKLIQEISMMTHKGIYPSLNILLEKDEGDETPDEMGDEVLDKPETPDESKTPDETETPDEDSDGEGESGGEGEGEVDVSSSEPSKPSEEEKAAAEKIDMEVVKDSLSKINNTIKRREAPSNTETEFISSSKYLDLKKFSLVLEAGESPEESFKEIQQYLKDFQDDSGYSIDQASDILIKGREDDLQSLLDDAMVKASKSIDIDPYKKIAEDFLVKIRKTFPVAKIEKAQDEFLEKYVRMLNQKKIKHTISNRYDVKSEKPTKYNSAQGSVKSG